MELRLNEDEESRPESLTPNFLSLLMAAENKKKGIFQLLSFKNKKQLVYSTKISDGFFEVKLMMVQQAAKQLSQGEIKQHSILQGWVRNHGDGMLIVRERMKHWSCQRIAGRPIPWKMKRQNVNNNGSNVIIWNSEDLSYLQISDGKAGFEKSEFQIHPLLHQEHITAQILNQTKGVAQQRFDHIRTKSFQNVTQTQSLLQVTKSCENKQDKQSNTVQQQKSQKPFYTELPIQEQVHNRQKKQQIVSGSFTNKTNKTQKQFSQRMESIMSFLFDSDEDEQLKNQPKKTSNNKTSFISSKQQNNQQRNRTYSQPVIDLKFIFSALSEEQASIQEETQKKKVESPCEESDDEAFIEWLNKRKIQKSQNSKQNTPMPQSVIKRRQEMYNQLMNSPEDDKGSQSISYPLRQGNQPLATQLQGLALLSLQNAYHGIYPRNNQEWYSLACLRCVGQPGPKDYMNAIMADETNEYLINALVAELQEGCLYRIGKGTIKATLDHNQWNTSHCQIQFDCRTALLQKIQNQICPKDSSSNYTPIEKIYHKQEGQTVHVFGIIRTVRNITTKNGVISNYELADPINRYAIALTQFDSNLSSEYIPGLINAAVTIYNAGVGSYKGKKNLVTKPKSIIKINWLPLSEEAEMIREWLQSNGRIETLDFNLVGFTQCENLSQIALVLDSQIIIKDVTILDISQKHTYLACVKCFKKVQDGRCRTCGKRAQHEVTQRLFLRGTIGDYTAVIPVLWDNSIAESILVEGFQAFEKKWALQTASVWIQRGSNDAFTIVKAELLSSRQRIGKIFDFIKSKIL